MAAAPLLLPLSLPPPHLPSPPTSTTSSAAAAALSPRSAELSPRTAAQLHARGLRLGDPSISARLIAHYAASSSTASAAAAAASLLPSVAPDHPLATFAFNSLIRALASSSSSSDPRGPALAHDLFLLMLRSHLRPNEFTFPFALKSSAALDLLPLGHQIHSSLLKSGLFPSNVFCASTLLDLYVKLATLGDARLVFDRIPHRTAVTWNSMICAYAQNGSWRRL